MTNPFKISPQLISVSVPLPFLVERKVALLDLQNCWARRQSKVGFAHAISSLLNGYQGFSSTPGTSTGFVQKLYIKHSPQKNKINKTHKKMYNAFILSISNKMLWAKYFNCLLKKKKKKKETPAWPSLLNRLLISQFLIKKANKERKMRGWEV